MQCKRYNFQLFASTKLLNSFLLIVPTSAPLSLNVFALSSTEINSTWGDTIENNGEITGYDLEYAEVEFDGTTITPPWTLVSTIGPERTLSVSGLKFWKHYAFRVAAKTIDPGVGPFSSHVITRTLEDRKFNA